MKIITCKRTPYNLPFQTPWHTSYGVMTVRQGFILQVETNDGLLGIGDCAPLPEMGTETLVQANQHYLKLKHLIQSDKPKLQYVLEFIKDFPPATAMAVETALLDILSQQYHLPLSKYLNPDAKDSCKVNINLGRIDENLRLRTENAIQKGFDTVKIKLGSNSLEYEIEQLEMLFDQYNKTDIKFRLDANQAWNTTQAKKFVMALNRFAGDKVDYLEEPLATPSLQQFENLQKLANYALALDESLLKFNMEQIIRNKLIKQIVVKPTLIGGLSKTLDWYKKLHATSIQFTITSLLESVVGITANLHVACAVDNNISHGLLSSEFFQYDLDKSPPLRKQQMLVSSKSGLGISFKNLEFDHGNI